jgi:hypothetical protein
MDDHHFTVDNGLTGKSSAPTMTENRWVQSSPLLVYTFRFSLFRFVAPECQAMKRPCD